MSFSNTRDPQLRRYVGLTQSTAGGVYVTDLFQGGPAEKAGLQKGDIITDVDGQPIDPDGNYPDRDYGKISLTHLVATRHFDGEPVKFTVFRKGESKELEVKIAHRSVDQYVIEPYVIDRPPHFYVVGGLVLQELSRQYLKEWGADWLKKSARGARLFRSLSN
jgi:predicted metalloprotease with PDZ domain